MRYFPRNSRAESATAAAQFAKLAEEFEEVVEAYEANEAENLAMELFDLIHAAEGMIDRLTDFPERYHLAVLDKCLRRGNYTLEALSEWADQ